MSSPNEDVITHCLDSIPETYIEQVWDIEFSDIDNNLDHFTGFDDYEFFHLSQLKRHFLNIDDAEFNDLHDEFLKQEKIKKAILACLFREFSLLKSEMIATDQKQAEKCILAFEFYLKLIKSNVFYHNILLSKGFKIFDLLFFYKNKTKRKPDRILQAFKDFLNNPTVFKNLSKKIPHLTRIDLIQKILTSIQNIAYIYNEILSVDNFFDSIFPNVGYFENGERNFQREDDSMEDESNTRGLDQTVQDKDIKNIKKLVERYDVNKINDKSKKGKALSANLSPLRQAFFNILEGLKTLKLPNFWNLIFGPTSPFIQHVVL